jgi:hypothetical protein
LRCTLSRCKDVHSLNLAYRIICLVAVSMKRLTSSALLNTPRASTIHISSKYMSLVCKSVSASLEPINIEAFRSMRNAANSDSVNLSRLQLNKNSSSRLLNVPGVGQKNEALLNAVGVRSISDLLLLHTAQHGADHYETQSYLKVWISI